MEINSKHQIRIHHGRITDSAIAKELACHSPKGYRKVQDVLVTTKRSSLHKFKIAENAKLISSENK